MNNDDKIVSAERFFREQQLRQVLPEMEEERVATRRSILEAPGQDAEALNIMHRIYDAYMGEFISFVRRHRGGLQPYSFQYFAFSSMASPATPYQLNFCHRDIESKVDTPIAQFAVVRIPRDDDYPVNEVPSPDAQVDIAESLTKLNECYAEFVEEENLTSSVCASLFYLPYMAAMGTLFKSAADGPSCHESVVDPMEALSEDELFFPFDFYFDSEDPDPTNHTTTVRLGRVLVGDSVLAVEAVFRLDNLRIAIASERKHVNVAPPNVTRH